MARPAPLAPPSPLRSRSLPHGQPPTHHADDPRRLGLPGGGSGQCRAPGADPSFRPPLADLSARAARHLGPRRRSARRADGQLRGRPSQPGRRPGGHAGPAAHRPRRRRRQPRGGPGAQRARGAAANQRRGVPPARAGLAGGRPLPSGPCGGCRTDARGRGHRRPRPRLHRRPRHTARRCRGVRGAPRAGPAARGPHRARAKFSRHRPTRADRSRRGGARLLLDGTLRCDGSAHCRAPSCSRR